MFILQILGGKYANIFSIPPPPRLVTLNYSYPSREWTAVLTSDTILTHYIKSGAQ